MIRLKVAIADTDDIYISKLSNFFNVNYREKVEVHSFTQLSSLLNFINTNKVDVLLVNDAMGLDLKVIPERIAFAYLVDSASLETVNNKRTVCKFQKADLIYKEALSLYSENSPDVLGIKSAGDGNTSVVSFYSCSGGCGSSTVAAACCLNLVAKGKRVLYLNLEHFGTPQIFFNSAGSYNLSDIIFALKSKKSNLALKLESFVRQDQSGVCFFEAGRTPLDIFEMTGDDISRLIDELKMSGIYDYIIIDSDFQLNDMVLTLMQYANYLIFISDGSEVSNIKFSRLNEALNIIETQKNISLVHKIAFIYNKFHKNTSKVIEGVSDTNVFGVVGEYAGVSNLQIAKQISQTQIFSSLC